MKPPNDPSPVAIDWAKTSGDNWAQRWKDTDRCLEPLHPYLVSAVADRAPAGPFRALDIGCGPGSTSIAVAEACPEASIVACDISPALVHIARERTARLRGIHVILGDAESVAGSEAPFDLFFSRHGVMFFADPVRAFRSFRSAANSGGALVFSCFQGWELNPWASELASAAAGKILPPPGRESGGFAFADSDYVLQILGSAGWSGARPEPTSFRYVAGEGRNAVTDALSFTTELGPASRVLQSLPDDERGDAVQRMRGVIEQYFNGSTVVFPAAAWIWSATAS